MAEPMAWPPRDEQGLATALAELGGAIAYPPTPPIAAAVGAELREHPARRSPGAFPWAGWRVGRSLALAIVALLVLAAAAVAFGIAIGGMRMTVGPVTP